MSRSALIAAFLAALTCMQANGQRRGPIPRSPMSSDELEQVVTELVEQGIPERDVRRLYSGIESPTTYRDAEIRSWFPEIRDGDTKAYACFLSITSPPSYKIAYVSRQSGHSVRVKELDCDESEEGLYSSIEESSARYHGEPENFYFLIDGPLSEKEAESLLDEYHRRVKPGLSSDLQELPVNSIERRNDSYILGLGRNGCACHAEVVLDVWEILGFYLRVRVIGEPTGGCI
ncbi:MAG TPA: hypothetical protein VF322_07120 [Gammaproteobacteria bacterium]